jgi:hypothetical protein
VGFGAGYGASVAFGVALRGLVARGRSDPSCADILMPPHDQDYGSHAFTARDPEGHIWELRDLPPGGTEVGRCTAMFSAAAVSIASSAAIREA